ncbi:MAG: hypothetical protein JWO06_3920 [Bacteroidota bacterium]|nr:hypothetical protein [Bacteroidota bacterium]
METNQTGPRQKKLFIAVVVAMLLINSVTLYFMFSEKHDKNELAVQKTELQENYTKLDQDYKNVSDSLDLQRVEIGQLKGKNSELDKIIAEKQEMIDQEKAELASSYSKNTLTSGELNKARKLITQYEGSIAELQKKLEDFTVQTHHLTAQNEQLSTDLNCEKETTADLSDKNEHLSKKVEVGSFLQIPKVDVEAIRKKNNGDEVAVKKIKSAESLKVSFETGANKVLDPGKVSLYVRIINPKGETISVAEQGSGIIPATETTKPIQYTKKTDISWNQNNKKVVVYWTRYIKDPGTYKVEVYQSGHVVGRGAVTLS